MPVDDSARMPDGFRRRAREVTRIQAFVDAAFAFAVTLLVISIDQIPDSRESLIEALKGIPAFAASFAIVVMFWWGHASFTRRYGLEDGPTILLSLLLVFLVLVFVYPLKMMYASFFQWVSAGRLAAAFHITSVDDIRFVFVVFGLGFASLGTTLALLTRHAWRRRESLQLDVEERVLTRTWELSWWFVPMVALMSVVGAVLVPAIPGREWLIALPGMCYGLLGAQGPLLASYRRRLRQRFTSAIA